MTHRVEQTFNAAFALVKTRVQAAGTKVFKHRRRIDGEQDEAPAIVLRYGNDDPQTRILSAFDSVLTLKVTGIVVAADVDELYEKINQLRAETHIALMADPTLGLSFVLTTEYGGAEEPQESEDGELLAAAQRWAWLVHYRMDLADPN